MSNAKEYLQKMRMYDARIEGKMLEVQHLKAMITKITPTLKDDVVTASGNQDKLGDAIAKIVDLENEINKDIDTYINLKREVTAKLEKLENPNHYKVLEKRYVQYYTFERIATEMHYSYRNITKMHGRALQAFAKVMQEQ